MTVVPSTSVAEIFPFQSPLTFFSNQLAVDGSTCPLLAVQSAHAPCALSAPSVSSPPTNVSLPPYVLLIAWPCDAHSLSEQVNLSARLPFEFVVTLMFRAPIPRR